MVVFVFAAVLMMAHGIDKMLIATGSKDDVIVARENLQTERSSIVLSDDYNTLLTLPHIAMLSGGKLLVSGETVVIINRNKHTGGLSNVCVRGVASEAFVLGFSNKNG